MERNEDTNIESGNGAVIDEMNKESIQSGKKSKELNNDQDDNETTDGRISEPT
ncbi:MAG TPA: hypothetical protein VJ697_14380 [Nitrososphaeraceae archaeon]|nr:hypothetical protein [Nitrososphaeraceae archaeon]